MISEKNLVIINDKYIKKLLSDPDMEEYVQKIISLVTDISLEELNQGFKMLHPDIGVGRETVDSEADLIYIYKNAYINMEINMVYSKTLDIKNYVYTNQLFLRDISSSKDYQNVLKVIQINIDNYDRFGKNLFVYQSVVMESKTYIERNDYLEIYDINLDYLRKVDYNNIKKDSLEYYLYFMIVEDIKKIKFMYEGDGLMERVLGKVTSMMGAIDELLLYDRKKVESSSYYQDGKKDGMKEGLKIGKREERVTRSMEIAKNLLNDNIDVKKVMKYTGLSKQEIKELQKDDLKKQKVYM